MCACVNVCEFVCMCVYGSVGDCVCDCESENAYSI